MGHRLRTSAGKSLYKLRQQIVEPVFGILKSVLGFRQFRLRGRAKVALEWTLFLLAYNLKRLHRLGAGLPLAGVNCKRGRKTRRERRQARTLGECHRPARVGHPQAAVPRRLSREHEPTLPPRAPLHMYHCTGDMDVLFANSQVALASFQQPGASQVQLIDPLPTADHGGCVLPSLLNAKAWFDTLRQ